MGTAPAGGGLGHLPGVWRVAQGIRLDLDLNTTRGG